MRIGIDITPVIYQGSGVATYTRQLVRHLLPQAKKDHFVLFASTLRGKKKIWQYLESLSAYANFSVKIFPFPPKLTELAWNKLHRISVERLVGEVDVFHAWDWQQPPAKKAKLVTTIHDLTPLLFPDEQASSTISAQKHRLKWVAREASAIIADSQATKNDIQKRLSIEANKIHRIYLAASVEFAEFSNQNPGIKNQEINKVKNKYNIKGDYILSVGTREPRKNLARVIEAFKLSAESNLQLVIAGKYGWGKKLDAKRPASPAGRYPLEVNILGYVAQQDLPALYAGAKMLVYPSLYEGFGLPLVEAMSVGCPVVASNRGSLKEVSGSAAITVNPEKPSAIAAGIKTVLSDSSGKMIKAGLIQARKFSWRKTARETLSVYKLAAKS